MFIFVYIGISTYLYLGISYIGISYTYILVYHICVRVRTSGAGADPVGEGPPLVAERAVLLRLFGVEGFRVQG